MLFMSKRLKEAVLLLSLVAALLTLLALLSYSPADPGWSFTGHSAEVKNWVGRTGAWTADIGLYLLGFAAYLLPLVLVWLGANYYRNPRGESALQQFPFNIIRWTGLVLGLLGAAAFLAVQVPGVVANLPMEAGGILGKLLANLAVPSLGVVGGSVLMLAALLLGVTLFTGLSWVVLMEYLGSGVLHLTRSLGAGRLPGLPKLGLSLPQWRLPRLHLSLDTGTERHGGHPAGSREPTLRLNPELIKEFLDERVEPSLGGEGVLQAGLIETVGKGPEVNQQRLKSLVLNERSPSSAIPVEELPGLATTASFVRMMKQSVVGESQTRTQRQALTQARSRLLCKGELPPLDLLDKAPPRIGGYSKQTLLDMSRQVEEKLADFGVKADVVEVHPGPVVTLFELMLAPGTKASKVTGLSNDLARSLSTSRVRVVEVIPGKTTIGLEIPNEEREMVYLHEIMGSRAYQDSESLLTLCLGKDIGGEPVVTDLAKMPHGLIAGTTGSGKSVAINAMILSLLYKASPEEVRLIMVDPKMLELSVYEGIPHLLTPVVTDMKEAANALRWCVAEMERRYKLMASQGVRNIKGYNRKVGDAIAAGEPIPDPFFNPAMALDVDGVPTLEKMPYIVVVIDELADMMMVVGKKVEELIARLAQKARAAGIHLLLATQRPSVDVITGLIKANIPTRLSFQVSSRIDSRTILDQMGAENLLGHGDGLYLAPGGSVVQRVHGAFVDDPEVHRVVDFLKQTGAPNYLDEILQEPSEMIPGLSADAAGVDLEDADPLYDEAVEFVIQSRRASISSVQRKLKIGYNRAARLIEEMERVGLVSAPEHNGNRQVLAPPAYED
jgi:S-DNA-T family DNA segregation ATPase FtsK/SpoIIIE